MPSSLTCSGFAWADLLAAGPDERFAVCWSEVPEDVSVVGFDNRDISKYTSPQLTTIAQDILAKVAAAVSMLLDRIEGGPGKTEGTVLATQLVERESVRVL
ncbi:substrate-binding domain-containing protein [Arthrobacter silvisoli]|uniref:substrate-binding domain-containing protein n=1 Tax=Arthrobacter silvisoli TaxID=2291022 RepID=UPI001B349925|nr:substrate-binding domain-containing protein [Arthrobacter silvisoli]